MTAEITIKIAAKLYERREVARTLLGETYPEQIREAESFIREYMATHGKKLMEAVLEISKSIEQKAGPAAAMASLLISAASVEMCEKGERDC